MTNLPPAIEYYDLSADADPVMAYNFGEPTRPAVSDEVKKEIDYILTLSATPDELIDFSLL